MSVQPVAWGIIGAGAIAKAFIHGVNEGSSGKVVAVASRGLDKAQAFAKEHSIATAHGSYEAILADDSVEAVYIATPHPMHAQWAIRAAETGKHVLCEKPMGVNHAQTMAMFEAARAHGTFMMEAFMYRCHPQTAKLVELLRSGAIGQVRMVRATFGFGGGDAINPSSRLFDNDLAGGGILDVGCYAVSMSRLIAGAVDGKPFANPVQVTGSGQLGETGVDEWAAGTLKFSNNIVAQVATAVRAGLENTVFIAGSAGSIFVPNPWAASRDKAPECKIIVRSGKDTQEITIPSDRTAFSYEVDAAGKAIRAGKQQPDAPAMTWDDTLGNLATLDKWRQAIGLTYEMEKPHPSKTNIVGRPVAPRQGHTMKYQAVPGLDRPVSKLIFGALTSHGSFARAEVLFDKWIEVGGNTFDTAHVYGLSDKILGHWLTSRGIRDQVNILAKGAHTPNCTPEGLTRQLHESLSNLQTDHAEIYIMHRDNEEVPVGEFIDVLNEHADAGRITVFGGSNWSIDRFLEANAYAAKHGKRGMTILNNNLSLARMVDPVWDGCIHVSDSASRRKMFDHGIVHFSWSSQARGFFTERAGREILDDKQLVRCWYSEDNFARKLRAEELARKKGVLPINIAAAYVLCQPFASFALIGPETPTEMVTSLPGLDVTLTQEEIDWLWGGDA